MNGIALELSHAVQVIAAVERRDLRVGVAPRRRLGTISGFPVRQDGAAEIRRAPIGIPAIIIVEEPLHILRHRVIFVGVRPGPDLRSRQVYGQFQRLR